MDDRIRQIASRMRELREGAGASPAEAARALALPEAAYLAYEKGEEDIPIGLLSRFAAHFKAELTSLLTGSEPHLSLYAVVRKGQGPSADRHHDYRYEALAPHFAHKRAEPFLVTVDPKPEGTPVHPNSHPGQEFDHLLEGTLQVVIGEHEVVLEAGDSIFFDSTAPHAMRALGGRPARFLAVIL